MCFVLVVGWFALLCWGRVLEQSLAKGWEMSRLSFLKVLFLFLREYPGKLQKRSMKHKSSLQKACDWPMTIEELALVISSRSYFTARRAKIESKFVSELKSAWKIEEKKIVTHLKLESKQFFMYSQVRKHVKGWVLQGQHPSATDPWSMKYNKSQVENPNSNKDKSKLRQ